MGEKHVAVCEKCGTEGELYAYSVGSGRPPNNWWMVGHPGDGTSAGNDILFFCSVSCIGMWADHDAPEENDAA